MSKKRRDFGELIRHFPENGVKLFPSLVPSMSPLFLSLPSKSDVDLMKDGGALGEIWRLLKDRDGQPGDFRELLTAVVRGLEGRLLEVDRNRLIDLLRYAMALVYHYRGRPERDGLRQVVEESVRTHSIQREVGIMGQTIREATLEEGEKFGEKIGKELGKVEGLVAGKQEMLLRQLRKKFGKRVTARVTKLVNSTENIGRLDAWSENILDADTLQEVGLDS